MIITYKKFKFQNVIENYAEKQMYMDAHIKALCGHLI